MKTFKQFTNETLFDFILETPWMNTYFSKEKMDILTHDTRQLINDSPSPEEKVDQNFFHKTLNGDHAYFNRDDNGEINAFSLVTKDNVHRLTHKNTGSAQQIHSFMIHHAEQYGSIKSDTTNTKGSKHLWTSLVKSNPTNKKFHTINSNTEEKNPIDANNIDGVSDKIWGRHFKFNNIILVMTHHDPA